MEPTIYLFFKGNCLEATTHYVETLGGEIWGTLLNGDAPHFGVITNRTSIIFCREVTTWKPGL